MDLTAWLEVSMNPRRKKRMVCVRENPIEMVDLGGNPILGNLHLRGVCTLKSVSAHFSIVIVQTYYEKDTNCAWLNQKTPMLPL